MGAPWPMHPGPVSSGAEIALLYLRAIQALAVLAGVGLAFFYSLGGNSHAATLVGALLSTFVVCLLPTAFVFFLIELICRRLMRSIRNAEV